MPKKIASFFRKKIGVTPSVAAPSDTNPSDVTVNYANAMQHNPLRDTIILVDADATTNKAKQVLSVVRRSETPPGHRGIT